MYLSKNGLIYLSDCDSEIVNEIMYTISKKTRLKGKASFLLTRHENTSTLGSIVFSKDPSLQNKHH